MTPYSLERCSRDWASDEERVLARADAVGWETFYRIYRTSDVEAFEQQASCEEKAELDGFFEVQEVYNRKPSDHVMSTSLFWKHVDTWSPELPVPTLSLMQNASALGLVHRFDPWHHYVQPLLRGAALIAKTHPSVTVRVYLANDLQFLLPLLLEHCEVYLMKHASLRSQPGMLWRFLALEDGEDVVSIFDADALEKDGLRIIAHSERLRSRQEATWRHVGHAEADEARFFIWRPVVASWMGTRVRLPARRLIDSAVWHCWRGLFGQSIKHPVHGILSNFGSVWPGYGVDECIVASVFYPRLLPYGIYTPNDPGVGGAALEADRVLVTTLSAAGDPDTRTVAIKKQSTASTL